MGDRKHFGPEIVAELELRAAQATFARQRVLARRRTLQSMGARKAATEQAQGLKELADDWRELARYAKESAS